MWYGKFSNKYSGRHGRTERLGKAGRRALALQNALVELRRKAFQKAAYIEARAKAKEKRTGLPGILDELKNIFRRAS